MAFVLAGLCGCSHLPIPMARRTPAPLPEKLAHYYDTAPLALKMSVQSTEPADDFEIQRLTLTAPLKPSFRPIRIDWYKPHEAGAHPAILMSPILADTDLYIREFARFFAGRRLHAVLVYRPKEIFTGDRALEDIEKHFHESIVQLRHALDWLEIQPSVDPERIGSFSISMGAILTLVLTAIEPRIQASVLALPAGHIPEIIMSSKDKTIRKRRVNYLKENNLTPEEALQKLKAVIVSEPMTFAPAIDPDRVFMVTGLFDRVLGLRNSLRLWWAMGRPRLLLLPTGHYTAVLATADLKVISYSFLKRKLKSRPTTS